MAEEARKRSVVFVKISDKTTKTQLTNKRRTYSAAMEGRTVDCRAAFDLRVVRCFERTKENHDENCFCSDGAFARWCERSPPLTIACSIIEPQVAHIAACGRRWKPSAKR
jgi:hypothetical protein